MSTILSKDFGFKNASSILPENMGFQSADGDADKPAPTATSQPEAKQQAPTECASLIYKRNNGRIVKGLIMVVGSALVFGAVVYLVYGGKTE